MVDGDPLARRRRERVDGRWCVATPKRLPAYIAYDTADGRAQRGPPDDDATYESLLEASPAPINLFDASGTTVWGNDAVLDLLGLDGRDELIGRSVRDFIHPDYHDLAAAEIEAVIDERVPVGPTAMELVRADGQVRSIRVSTAPGTYDGEPIGQAIVIDDTALLETREELAEHRGLIDHVLDTLPDAYYRISPSGELLDWNERTVEVTGYESPELRSLPVTDLFTAEDGERLRESFSTVLKEGRDSVEADLVTKDGRRIPYEFHGGRLGHADGEHASIVGIGRDVSDRVERDQHLRVVDRVLRHNLRNKLNVIMGYAELLREAEPEDRDRQIHIVLETGRGLLETVEKEREIVDLLVENVDPEPVDLDEAVTRVVRELREAHPAATVDYEPAGPTIVRAVPELTLAVRELVENAILHNPGGRPTVELDVATAEVEVELHVRDDGPGVPEIEQTVFDGLEEGPIDHSLGLGLWFVNWVVDRSDGRLEFESSGEGSHVTVYLPRAS